MKTKFSADLFLEKAELSRIDKGVRDDGFVLNSISNTSKWGIVRNKFIDPNFEYFKLLTTAYNDKFRIKNGIAFDKDRLCINYHFENEDITIPLINTNYWVKISHEYDSTEVGTISIGGSNLAVMTGVGTKFTEVLRGQPNFPAKIRFKNSSNYTLEYEILEVISDTSAVVQGIFNVPETELEYCVVGTFTPGVQPLSQDKEPFQYDSCKVTLIQSSGSMPPLVDGKEFIIGLVSYNGAGMIKQDYRFTCFHESIDRYHVDSITETLNKLAGIEKVKKFGLNGRINYFAGIDWKFNITGEVQNNGLNVIDITSGYGGVWDNTQLFQDGDFDGWRYYYEDGNYSNILLSVKQGTSTIKLYVDSVRIGSGNGVCVTPNAEEVEIEAQFLNSSNIVMFSKNYFFSIAMQNPTIVVNQDEILTNNQTVKLYYILKNHFRRTTKRQFNVSTYYNENAFNNNGDLINQSQTTTSPNLTFQNNVTISNAFVPVRTVIAWHPLNVTSDVLSMFDNTGLGLTSEQFAGWAICNGSNNTPDLRGRFIVGTLNSLQIPASVSLSPEVDPINNGNPNYLLNDKGGEAAVQLVDNQMPKHSHNVNDGGHTHSAIS